MFFRQRDGLVGRCQAGVHRTNSGMFASRNSVPQTSPPCLLIMLYCRGMLAMCCYQAGCVGENTFQDLFIVHQHISGRSSHKHLHPTGLRSRKRFQFVKIIVRRAEVKTVVRQRRMRGTLKFLTQRLKGRCWWRNVRHFHKTGNASHYSGS